MAKNIPGEGAVAAKQENGAPTILPRLGFHLHERRDAGNSPGWSLGSDDDRTIFLDGGAPCSCLGGGASLSPGSSGFGASSYDDGTT
jgi:hypothetical protein